MCSSQISHGSVQLFHCFSAAQIHFTLLYVPSHLSCPELSDDTSGHLELLCFAWHPLHSSSPRCVRSPMVALASHNFLRGFLSWRMKYANLMIVMDPCFYCLNVRRFKNMGLAYFYSRIYLFIQHVCFIYIYMFFFFKCCLCLSAPTQMLEPVTLQGIVSCVLSVLCGGLNLLRGVHAIESILQVRT